MSCFGRFDLILCLSLKHLIQWLGFKLGLLFFDPRVDSEQELLLVRRFGHFVDLGFYHKTLLSFSLSRGTPFLLPFILKFSIPHHFTPFQAWKLSGKL